MSSYSCEQIIFTDSLKRDSLTKGAVLVSDVNGVFQHVTPSSDNQILISNTSAPGGAEWSIGNQGIGIGFTTLDNVPIPSMTNTVYFLMRNSTSEPVGRVMPSAELINFNIVPDRTGGVNGWSTTPTNITGGNLDFYYCFVEFSTQNIIANIKYYSTCYT